MAYSLEFSKKAKKELDSLERDTSIRILKKLRETISDPNRYLERSVGGILYKLRVGDFRVIVLLNNKDNKLYVTKIGHRRNIYDRL